MWRHRHSKERTQAQLCRYATPSPHRRHPQPRRHRRRQAYLSLHLSAFSLTVCPHHRQRKPAAALAVAATALHLPVHEGNSLALVASSLPAAVHPAPAATYNAPNAPVGGLQPEWTLGDVLPEGPGRPGVPEGRQKGQIGSRHLGRPRDSGARGPRAACRAVHRTGRCGRSPRGGARREVKPLQANNNRTLNKQIQAWTISACVSLEPQLLSTNRLSKYALLTCSKCSCSTAAAQHKHSTGQASAVWPQTAPGGAADRLSSLLAPSVWWRRYRLLLGLRSRAVR